MLLLYIVSQHRCGGRNHGETGRYRLDRRRRPVRSLVLNEVFSACWQVRAPQSTKMGNIASPCPYDAAIRFWVTGCKSSLDPPFVLRGITPILDWVACAVAHGVNNDLIVGCLVED